MRLTHICSFDHVLYTHMREDAQLNVEPDVPERINRRLPLVVRVCII